MIERIMADFKQATVKKPNTVVLQFEAVKDAAWMQGQIVTLTIESAQQELPVGDIPGQTTINVYHVDKDTGKVEDFEPINAYDADVEKAAREVE